MTTAPNSGDPAAILDWSAGLSWSEVCLNLSPAQQHPDARPPAGIAGRPWLIERFAGLQYQIGPDTFFPGSTPPRQSNCFLALQACSPRLIARIVGCYCGIGTSPCRWALGRAQVLGLNNRPAVWSSPHQCPPQRA